MAEIAKEVKPDYIKTSTGFGTGGATVKDVELMKSVVGDKVKVKAAGGIRDLKTALAMVEAGAERLGTSAGVEIIEAYSETTVGNWRYNMQKKCEGMFDRSRKSRHDSRT